MVKGRKHVSSNHQASAKALRQEPPLSSCDQNSLRVGRRGQISGVCVCAWRVSWVLVGQGKEFGFCFSGMRSMGSGGLAFHFIYLSICLFGGAVRHAGS